MRSEVNAECVVTAGKATSLLSQEYKQENGLRKHGRVIKGVPLVTVLPVKWLLSVCSLWSQAGCILPSFQELLGTSSQSGNWEWWLLKNTLLRLHLELAIFSCQFLANCVLGRTMEKNPPRICEYSPLGETLSHLLSSSANVNALYLNSNSIKAIFPIQWSSLPW